jgi:hypothetical protein
VISIEKSNIIVVLLYNEFFTEDYNDE